ncbi:transglutaminase family protein [Butyrivibrio sp. X503]|uniref:transglutaminase domain-containing protein n=1 Tax=Butyrivibrio sp. X503 TaxID=2364878 RepID=UPI000EA86736|nr:transglutaminase family protein [Butyrivibrio sp. X503]RKM54114.1 transglutaminase family protein [Butyrivibrio sp. X503]
MRKRNLLAVLLCGIILTACTKPSGPVENTGNATYEQTTEDGSTEASTEISGEGASTDGASNASTDASSDSSTVSEESVVSDEDFSFNPHVSPKKLYDAYGAEEWETFFKLCDALRAGEDTFECPSREIYEWCFSGAPLDEYMPVARHNTEMNFTDGYTDGVGHITYEIPKDEFVKKQKEFEKTVMDIVNENVDKDYTDFEKCIALYEYMVNNYAYDYEELQYCDVSKMNDLPAGTYGTYRTFRDKKGVCDDLSSVYNYLLLQCGVDAVKYEGNVFGEGHAWTYVTIDGVGYFIDPTWGLPDQSGTDLQYFMMTSADREPEFSDMHPLTIYYDHKNTGIDFTATDDRYAVLHEGEFQSLDIKTKTLYYKVGTETKEFHYE